MTSADVQSRARQLLSKLPLRSNVDKVPVRETDLEVIDQALILAKKEEERNRKLGRRETQGFITIQAALRKQRSKVTLSQATGRSVQEIKSAESTALARERAEASRDARRKKEGVVVSEQEFRKRQRERFVASGKSRQASTTEQTQAKRAVISRGEAYLGSFPIGFAGSSNTAFAVSGSPQQRIQDVIDVSKERSSRAVDFVGESLAITNPSDGSLFSALGSRLPSRSSSDIIQPQFPDNATASFDTGVEGLSVERAKQIKFSAIEAGQASLSASQATLTTPVLGVESPTPAKLLTEGQRFFLSGGAFTQGFRAEAGRQLADDGFEGERFTQALEFIESTRRGGGRDKGLLLAGGAVGAELTAARSIASGVSQRITGTGATRFSQGFINVGSRTGAVGAGEGVLISGGSQAIETGGVDPLQTGKAALFGFGTAGGVGGLIGGFAARGGILGRQGATTTNVAFNIVDPSEVFGDVVAGRIQRARGVKVPTIRVKGRTATFGSSVDSPIVSRVKTFSPSRSSERSFTPSFTDTGSRSFTPSFIKTDTKSITPTSTLTNTLTKTSTRTNTLIPSLTKTSTRTSTKTDTLTKVPIVTTGAFIPFLGEGKKPKKAGKKGVGRGKQRSTSFAPSFAALDLDLTGSKGLIPKGGFSGLELRRIVKRGKR